MVVAATSSTSLPAVPTEKRQRKKQGRETRLAELRAEQAKAQVRKRIIGGVVVAALVIVAAVVFSRGGDGTKVSTDKTTTTTAAATATTLKPGGAPPRGEPVAVGAKLAAWACPKADGSSPRTDQFPAQPPPTCIDPAKTYVARLTTSEGAMEYALDTKKTPVTANNFVVLSRYHYYDGTAITRIDQSIDILQTGSPRTQSIGDPGPGYSLPDEGTDFTYAEGDVVMARSDATGTSGAQYFVVVGPKAESLPGKYITFAKITTGLEVAKKVFALFQPCGVRDRECLGGAPSKVVTIEKVEIEER